MGLNIVEIDVFIQRLKTFSVTFFYVFVRFF